MAQEGLPIPRKGRRKKPADWYEITVTEGGKEFKTGAWGYSPEQAATTIRRRYNFDNNRPSDTPVDTKKPKLIKR